MKKIIYIAVAVFALGMVSCSKEEIKPNAAESDVPVWKSIGDDVNEPEPNGSGNDGGITDPNEDPEFSNTGS